MRKAFFSMKLRQYSACLAAAGMLLLSGCGGTDGSTGRIAVSDVTGTWVQTLSDGTQTLTLKSDMTYDKVIKLGGDFPMESDYHDTWSLSGDTISISYSDYGQISDYTVTLEGSTMIWDNGDSIQTWKKRS